MFKSCIEKYTEKCVPGQSTIHKNYICTIYKNIVLRIRLEISGGPIKVSLNETIDVDGLFVWNVMTTLFHGKQ